MQGKPTSIPAADVIESDEDVRPLWITLAQALERWAQESGLPELDGGLRLDGSAIGMSGEFDTEADALGAAQAYAGALGADLRWSADARAWTVTGRAGSTAGRGPKVRITCQVR